MPPGDSEAMEIFMAMACRYLSHPVNNIPPAAENVRDLVLDRLDATMESLKCAVDEPLDLYDLVDGGRRGSSREPRISAISDRIL